MLQKLILALLVIGLTVGSALGQNTSKDDPATKKVDDPISETLEKPVKPRGPFTVLVPNGDEIWNEGTVQKIEWDTQVKVKVDSVAIRLVEDVGVKGVEPKVIHLITVKDDPGEWTWEGVGPPMDLCKIEIEGFSREKVRLYDISDASFTIARDLIPLDPSEDMKKKKAKQSTAGTGD